MFADREKSSRAATPARFVPEILRNEIYLWTHEYQLRVVAAPFIGHVAEKTLCACATGSCAGMAVIEAQFIITHTAGIVSESSKL